MKQFKIAVGLLVASSCSLTMLLYYWNRSSLSETVKLRSTYRVTSLRTKPMVTKKVLAVKVERPLKHISLNDLYPDFSVSNSSMEISDELLSTRIINNPGCQIPSSVVRYDKFMKQTKKLNATCGKRAVFMKKVDRDKVRALIKPKTMKKYLRKSVNFYCCYRFIAKAQNSYNSGIKIKYTRCLKFEDSGIITLKTDFINVKCFEYDKRNVSHPIYDDVYAFAKAINVSKKDENCSVKYNVLMIGMDSMSTARLALTMPKTVRYFQENYWLPFPGYHKVEDNTFPNIMAALTGQNLTSLLKACSGKMDQCKNLIIWDKFKKAGYVTAYGEDYLRLPDTFTNKYAFQTPPTDHYMRPFFMKGETEKNNKSLVCAGKVSSGQQLLNYAVDFANTYRGDQFFGLFWMNSYSHNINSRPQDADPILENFLNQLAYTGVLLNTFIVFFSDHGLRFGEHRLKAESFYDERLPFLAFLTPTKFNRRHSEKIKRLSINRFRLITPYDLYNTLIAINDISLCRNKNVKDTSQACPKCHSLFEDVSENRTCRDVGIRDKWCACHNLVHLSDQDPAGVQSVNFVVSYIKSIIKTVQTKKCSICLGISLKNIVRMHFYYDEDKVSMFYVVAFYITPGNVAYEATVSLKNGKRELVGPVEDNTFPNIMAALTGQNLTSLLKACSGKMDQCKNLIIWDKFKKAGYVTAYGEDYLRLPDTFTNKYAFQTPPTDHYMRPFFMKGETEKNNKSLVCAGKVSSGQQLLNYAVDFANTYRGDQFFGLFWMNSYSHNINSRPQDADPILENFLNQLAYTGVLLNTFIVFFSDHGLRFGEHRLKAESFYDERLPFLAFLTPTKFNRRHSEKIKRLSINRFRLITPYDLYNTLIAINDISLCRNKNVKDTSQACPKCHSLFEDVSENRTCRDVGIRDKWCACHNLVHLSDQDPAGVQSVNFVVSYIKSIIKTVQTKKCSICLGISLKNIVRMHFYYDEDKVSMFYVVAFYITPGNVAYEATVSLKNGKRELVGPVSIISPFRGFGVCAVKRKDRLFCVCQNIEKC